LTQGRSPVPALEHAIEFHRHGGKAVRSQKCFLLEKGATARIDLAQKLVLTERIMALFSGLPADALGAIEKRDAIDLEKPHEKQKSLEFASGASLDGWRGWF
jgi:hypothetical protein